MACPSYHRCAHDSSTETARARTSTNHAESSPSCLRMSSPSTLIHAVNCTRCTRSTGGALASLPLGSAQGDATELKCAALACTASPRMLPKEARPSPTAPGNVNALAGSVACEGTAPRDCAQTRPPSTATVTVQHNHMQHEACGACGARSGHHRPSMPRDAAPVVTHWLQRSSYRRFAIEHVLTCVFSTFT